MDMYGKCGNETGTSCRISQEWPGYGSQAKSLIFCYCVSYLKTIPKRGTSDLNSTHRLYFGTGCSTLIVMLGFGTLAIPELL